ncbi:nucleotidyltransferase family protein [Nitrospira sp. Kam-Ns4a]
MRDLKALVLAAGKSSRIAPVAGGLPKPLLPFRGEPILGRNLRWLARQGIRHVWINLHYRPDDIRSAIGDGTRFGLAVRYSFEPEILGTAGAVRHLACEWERTFLVVYGDNLLWFDLQEFLRFHRAGKACVSVALFDRTRHPHTGIAGGRVRLSPDDRILEFCEGGGDHDSTLVSAGVYLVEPEVVNEIPHGQVYDFGRNLFPFLLAQGRALRGYLIAGYCLGVDTPESYQRAIELIESGEVTLV